jgi:hypothetical protein
MSQAEKIDIIDIASNEILSVLTSIKGLLILSEHYADPSELESYFGMMSTCVEKVEGIVQATQEKIRYNG